MIRLLLVSNDVDLSLPLASSLFNRAIQAQNMKEIVAVDSAFIEPFENNEEGEILAKIYTKYDLPIPQEAREFETSDFQKYDYILPFDLITQAELLNWKWKANSPISQIVMLRQFDHMADNLNVPSLSHERKNLTELYDLLYRSAVNLIEQIRKELRM